LVIRVLRISEDSEKRPSAALLSSFVVAAYIRVRLTPQNFERPRERDFAKLNLHLGIFEHPLERMVFQKPAKFQNTGDSLGVVETTKFPAWERQVQTGNGWLGFMAWA